MNQEQINDTLNRLIDLTTQGRLEWAPIYPDQLGNPDYSMQSTGSYWGGVTTPHAYAMQDDTFGFGMVVLQIKEPQAEEYDLHLFVMGESIDAKESDLHLLRDSVAMYLHDVQMGRFPNQQGQMEQMVQSAIAPFAAQNAVLEQEVQSKQEMLQQAMDIVETMSETIANVAKNTGAPPQAQAHQPQIPNPEEGDVLEESPLPLNSTTLRHALRYMLEPNENFDKFVTLERCKMVVHQVVRDLVPPAPPSIGEES